MQLEANRVSRITYECRDLGYGVESGTVLAYWTGEIDTWGKHIIKGVKDGRTLYLFADEIVSVRKP